MAIESPELTRVPLIGHVGSIGRYDDAEERRVPMPARSAWSTGLPAPLIAEAVATLREVYDALAPVHAGWAARMRAARDAVLAPGADLDATIAARGRLEREYQTIVVLRASELLSGHGFYPAGSDYRRFDGPHRSDREAIAAAALGGDDQYSTAGILNMGECGVRNAIRLSLTFGTEEMAAAARDDLRRGLERWSG